MYATRTLRSPCRYTGTMPPRVRTGVPALIASTASPYKFAASVLSALGETGETDEFLQLDRLAALSGMPCPPQLRNLQSKPVRFPDTCSKDRMLQSLYAFLHI